jgi:hypothetical protein
MVIGRITGKMQKWIETTTTVYLVLLMAGSTQEAQFQPEIKILKQLGTKKFRFHS